MPFFLPIHYFLTISHSSLSDLLFASLEEGLASHSYQYKDERNGGSADGDMQYKMDNEGVFSYRSYKMHNM